MFFHKKPPHEAGCLAVHAGAVVLLLLASLASLVGLLMAHYDPRDGHLIFGTMPASLSIIAFAVSLSLLMKQCIACMTSCEVCEMKPTGKKK